MNKIRGIFGMATLVFLSACGDIGSATVDKIDTVDAQDSFASTKGSKEDTAWIKGVRSRFASYARPELSQAGEDYSKRFRVEGPLGRVVASSIRKNAEMLAFLSRFPSGLQRICPRYEGLGFEQKMRVYLALFDALAYAESAYKTGLTYRESFRNGDGSPVISTGLLQISQSSARNHGGACEGATTARLKDGLFNLRCGFRIAKNQVTKRGALWFHNRDVYYWSTWSKGRNPRGFARFAGRLGMLVEDSDVWPTACGMPRGL